MPYAPSERFDNRSLTEGFNTAGQNLGEGIAKYHQNQRQMAALSASAEMIAQQHPDAVTPEMLEKFSKGNLGQRQALVGQMTAAVAEKFRTRQLDQTDAAQGIQRFGIESANTRADANLGESVRQFDLGLKERQFPGPTADIVTNYDAEGRPVGPKMLMTKTSPHSGDVRILPEDEPSHPNGEVVLDPNTGQRIGVWANNKVVLDDPKAVWQPGGTQIFVNPNTNQPMGAPPNAKTSAPAPSAAAAAPSGPPRVTTKAEYEALPKGTQFIGLDGKTYVRH